MLKPAKPRPIGPGWLWIVLCIGCCAAHAQAPTLQISPITVLLQPGQMATTLSVTNAGGVPTTVQMRPFRWDQQGSEDHLTPTDDLVVSPPIIQIDPGLTQTFRLILQRPAAGSEDSYRLLMDQLPLPASPGTVRMALRISLPVFAAGQNDTPPKLIWITTQDSQGLVIVARNDGGQHIRVINPLLLLPHGVTLALETGQNPYVLRGAAKLFHLAGRETLPLSAQPRLAARSDAGPIDVDLNAAPP